MTNNWGIYYEKLPWICLVVCPTLWWDVDHAVLCPKEVARDCFKPLNRQVFHLSHRGNKNISASGGNMLWAIIWLIRQATKILLFSAYLPLPTPHAFVFSFVFFASSFLAKQTWAGLIRLKCKQQNFCFSLHISLWLPHLFFFFFILFSLLKGNRREKQLIHCFFFPH